MEQPDHGFPALLKPGCDTKLPFEKLLPDLPQRKSFLQAPSAVAQGWSWALLARSGAVLMHQCLRGEVPGEQQCLVLPSEHPAASA